jgi:hypothetical protein
MKISNCPKKPRSTSNEGLHADENLSLFSLTIIHKNLLLLDKAKRRRDAF